MTSILPALLMTAASLAPLSPAEAVCHAAHKASAAVSQTVTLLDVQLGAGQDGVTLQWHRGPRQTRLGVPALRLGLLERISLGLHISIAITAGSGCSGLAGWGGMSPGALELVGMVPVPQATVAVRYRPQVGLSLLTPWYGLMARLGEPPGIHGRVAVGVGVSTGVMLGGQARGGGMAQPVSGPTSVTVGQPAQTGGWSTPTLRPPSLPSLPAPSRPNTGTSAIRR